MQTPYLIRASCPEQIKSSSNQQRKHKPPNSTTGRGLDDTALKNYNGQRERGKMTDIGTRETRIETTRPHSTGARKTRKRKMRRKQRSRWGAAGPLLPCWREVRPPGKTAGQVNLKRLNTELPYEPEETPFPDTRQGTGAGVQTKPTRTSRVTVTIATEAGSDANITARRADKRNAGYPHSGVSFGRERTAGPVTGTHLEHAMLRERSQLRKATCHVKSLAVKCAEGENPHSGKAG